MIRFFHHAQTSIFSFYRNALELVASGERVTSPKQLGVFGASYLLPVLAWLGVVKC